MKLITTLLAIFALAFSGCTGIGYDAQDSADNRRQDMIGYVLGLKEKPDQTYSEYGYNEHRAAVKRVEALKN